MTLYEKLALCISAFAAVVTLCAVLVALYNAKLPYRKRLKIVNREHLEPYYNYKFYKDSVDNCDVIILNKSNGAYKIQSIDVRYRNTSISVKEILTESGVATLPYTLDSFEAVGIESIGLAMSDIFAAEEYTQTYTFVADKTSERLKEAIQLIMDLRKPKFSINSAYEKSEHFHGSYSIKYYREAHLMSADIVNKFDIASQKQHMVVGENKFIVFFYKEVDAYTYRSSYLSNKVIEQLEMVGERKARFVPNDSTILHLRKDKSGIAEESWYIPNDRERERILELLQMTADLTEK